MTVRWFPGFVTLLKVVLLSASLLMVAGAFAVATGWRPSLHLFGEETTDRSGSAVLQSLTDLNDFHPVTAHFETVVDLEDDTDRVPDWLSGERVIYVGKGDVDAVVDFGGLDADSVAVSSDRTTVSVDVPEPTIATPVLDLEHSYVADHDEGLIDRFQGSDLEHRTQLAAIDQISAAAASSDSRLRERAEENTSAMLRGLLGSLGFTDVTVTFHADAT